MQQIDTYYFLGIGGIGMSAIARYFKAKGFDVAGYDRTSTVLTRELEAEGIAVNYVDEVVEIAEQYRADGNKEAEMIRNEVDKTKNILISDAKARAEEIKAQGEAEYMRILAQAYNTPEKQAFYNFTRALDAIKISLSGEDSTIILGKDSAIAKALMNP